MVPSVVARVRWHGERRERRMGYEEAGSGMPMCTCAAFGRVWTGDGWVQARARPVRGSAGSLTSLSPILHLGVSAVPIRMSAVVITIAPSASVCPVAPIKRGFGYSIKPAGEVSDGVGRWHVHTARRTDAGRGRESGTAVGLARRTHGHLEPVAEQGASLGARALAHDAQVEPSAEALVVAGDHDCTRRLLGLVERTCGHGMEFDGEEPGPRKEWARVGGCMWECEGPLRRTY